LIDNKTNQIVETTIRQIHPTHSDYKDWEFDWTKPEQMGYNIYAVCVKGNRKAQGLVSIMQHTGYAEVGIVEAAPWNNPHNSKFQGQKQYNGVGGHLFAEAARQSMEAGNEGYVSFIAKTNLIEYYQKELGATLIGGQRMAIDEEAAKALIERYYGGAK
jgi:hypothetical protein